MNQRMKNKRRKNRSTIKENISRFIQLIWQRLRQQFIRTAPFNHL